MSWFLWGAFLVLHWVHFELLTGYCNLAFASKLARGVDGSLLLVKRGLQRGVKEGFTEKGRRASERSEGGFHRKGKEGFRVE